MNTSELKKLESLNKLQLSDSEEAAVLGFFEKQKEELTALDAIDTANVERMVHVMPMINVLREDVMKKDFTRDELQEDAPESYDGYWQVPRLVE